ncbi:MAG TPA: EamA family transporter [Solirubrobacteraceae bacterium]|nr:EamA family transporter [Solirubrobacteraceae bacterium]
MLIGVASIQFGAALAATLFSQAGPAGTALLRLAFAALILLAIARPSVRAHPPARLRLAALLGVVLAAMNLSFYEALARIPLGAAVTIEFIGPLGVAVASSRRALDLLWVALAATGIALLSGGLHGAHSVAGLALAALAGCFWAAYILINSRAAAAFSGASGLALSMTVGASVVLGPGLAGAGLNLFDPKLLILGIAVALLGSVIPYSLETEALRRLRAGVFSVLMSLEPAVAALAGWIVLGQRLSAAQAVAIALVVIASAGASRAGGAPPVEV